jgi:hypothetical protein
VWMPSAARDWSSVTTVKEKGTNRVPDSESFFAKDQAHCTHRPNTDKRFRCELNRKKSKFERKGLLLTIDFEIPRHRRMLIPREAFGVWTTEE